MSWLARLQSDFVQSLRQGSDRVRPALAEEGGIAADLGLGIYQHAYRARLAEALANDHAALARYLGESAWHGLCTDYIALHPSRQRSLRVFGDALPDFVAGIAPYDAHPEVADLARFERALLDTFDAADAPSPGWDTVAGLPADAWPTLAPRLHPSLRRLALRSNAVALWTALKDDATPPAVELGEVHWVTWRDADLLTRFRSLTASEAVALDQAIAGADVATLCEAMQDIYAAEDVPGVVVGYLRAWADEGWVAGWSHAGAEVPERAHTA